MHLLHTLSLVVWFVHEVFVWEPEVTLVKCTHDLSRRVEELVSRVEWIE
jgi:hypothetical protein